MKACPWGVGLVMLALGFARAGEASPHEQAILRMLGNLHEIGKILQSIETEEGAEAAKPDLRKAAKNWIEARAKTAKMPPPERAEKERLTKIYKPKVDDALKKMFTEIRRVEVIPGGKDALKEIRGVLSKDEK